MQFFLLLFQADQLMFALHFVRGMHPELFQENVSAREEKPPVPSAALPKTCMFLSLGVRLTLMAD